MKRFLGIFFFVMVNAAALIVVVSCSNNAPNSAFVSPVKTISANNPTWSPTPTSTFTLTPTATPAFPVSGFNSPYALAISSTGVEYVGDNTNNGLVRQYNAGILDTWPNGKAKGTGASYPNPAALTTDSNGNVYVVGGGTGVYKYLSNGDFSAVYNTSTPLSSPTGLASTGNTLFVSDTGHNQIVTFSLPGGAATTLSSLSGLTYAPAGLAVNSAATTLYVAGNDNNVHIYWGTNWSSSTIIPGFNSPYAVAVDASGDIFVSDTNNKQIEEFTAGNYNQSPANIFGVGILNAPRGIALDSSGNIYVVDSSNGDFYEFAP